MGSLTHETTKKISQWPSVKSIYNNIFFLNTFSRGGGAPFSLVSLALCYFLPVHDTVFNRSERPGGAIATSARVSVYQDHLGTGTSGGDTISLCSTLG